MNNIVKQDKTLVYLFLSSLLFVNYNIYFNLLPLLPILLLMNYQNDLVNKTLIYRFLLGSFILFLFLLKHVFLDPVFLEKGVVFSEITPLRYVYYNYLILLLFFSFEIVKKHENTCLEWAELALKFLMFSGFILLFLSIFGLNLYPVEILAGKEARVTSNESIGLGMVGIVEEPSTFGAMIILLSIILFSSNFNPNLGLFGLFFSLLTFSTAIWFLVPVMLSVIIFLYFEKFRDTPLLLIGSGTFFLIAFFALVTNFQLEKITDGYAVSIRLYLIELLSDRDPYLIFWGAGPWGFESIIYDLTDPWYGALRSASINDLGSFVFIYIFFGVLGIFSFALFVIFAIKDIKIKVLFLIATLVKLSIFHPLFIFFMAIASQISKRDHLKS